MSALTKTDEELMRSFQKGDPKSFEELYRKYKAPIFSFLARQYPASGTAAELTQEVFLRVIRSASAFRHGSQFATWIFTIARNLAIDTARKARHRKTDSLDDKPDENGPSLVERLPNKEPRPERAFFANELREDIAAAIANLPDEQREVFLLREYHGLPFCEIARVVNAREGTVKSRMRYALQSLREKLAGWSDYARTLP